ncbi:MAG: hypothetical protein AB1609_22990 [Bacillota bacterium]
MHAQTESQVAEMYVSVLPIVADEARRAGCEKDEALSAAGVLFMTLLSRRALGEDGFRRYFRISLRYALARERRLAAREIPVDSLAILEAVQPDGQPLRDAEAKLWWQQLLDSADLSPAERKAAEAVGSAALEGLARPRASRRQLCKARRRLRRALEGSADGGG